MSEIVRKHYFEDMANQLLREVAGCRRGFIHGATLPQLAEVAGPWFSDLSANHQDGVATYMRAYASQAEMDALRATPRPEAVPGAAQGIHYEH